MQQNENSDLSLLLQPVNNKDLRTAYFRRHILIALDLIGQ